MSGQLGTIPYPFLGATGAQPITNTWTDQPQPGQPQPPGQPPSPGWFMPEAGGAATMSPATGRPYIDMSLPPYVAPAPVRPAVAPSVPVVTGQPPTYPPTAVVQPPQQEHGQPPVLPMGPDGKPQSTREYTVHPDGSITKNVLPPPWQQQQAQARQQQYAQMTAQTGLTGPQQLQQRGQQQAQAPGQQQAPPSISPMLPQQPIEPLQLTSPHAPPPPMFTPPTWAPSAAAGREPITHQHAAHMMGTSYSADDHERTAQRYRAMLA